LDVICNIRLRDKPQKVKTTAGKISVLYWKTLLNRVCYQPKFILPAFGFLMFAANTGIAATIDEPLEAMEKRIGGRLGVAAFDTGSGKRMEHRPNERFPMCSTFKFLAAAAVLQRSEAGKDDLKRFVRYGSKDILAYAPVTKVHLAEGGMSLGALCAAAIEQSDNTAGNLLLQTIGGPSGLTAFARTLGDQMTRLDRTEPELNDVKAGDDRDTTTPAAMQHDMILLLTGNVLATSSRHQLEEWLVKNETGNSLIRAGVPKDWQVGDKTGRSSKGSTNDIAIIRPPNRAPVFLVIYSAESSVSTELHDAAIANIARIVAAEL
jgi:beta-lactamase class A